MVIYEFGRRDSGSLIGYVTAIEMVGGAIGSICMGRLYDVTGSYAFGWIVLTVLGVLMAITLLLSTKLSNKLMQSSNN